MTEVANAVKGAAMNNILFFLTPKAMCAFVYDDFTVRQALEKMEAAGYAALPILNNRGEYRGNNGYARPCRESQWAKFCPSGG